MHLMLWFSKGISVLPSRLSGLRLIPIIRGKEGP